MKDELHRWFMIAVWSVVIIRLLLWICPAVHDIPPPPDPALIVQEWTEEEEAEMEWLEKNLDWHDPAVCQDPRVIKYELCDSVFSERGSEDAYDPFSRLPFFLRGEFDP